MTHFRARPLALLLPPMLALLQPVLPAAAWGHGPAEPSRGHAAHPALWKLQNGGSTLYLFGTIHALPPHFTWETPAIEDVVAHSDRLVLEAVIDQDPAKSAAALFRIGAATTPLPPIDQRIAPKYRAALEALVTKSQVPRATLDRLKTWAVAMVLFGSTVQTLGVSSAEGVEEHLKAEFRAAHKPIEGLETLDEQLGFFNTLDETEQRAFLKSVVDQRSDDAADFGKMLGAWAHGNEKGIEHSFDRDMQKSSALRTVLIVRRNAHWAEVIRHRLQQPGTQLIAVGAGHLVGPDSVLALLARRGITAERVE